MKLNNKYLYVFTDDKEALLKAKYTFYRSIKMHNKDIYIFYNDGKRKFVNEKTSFFYKNTLFL